MFGEKETGKYLRIFEMDNFKQAGMKEKFKNDYPKRRRKLLESKLNSTTPIKDINAFADYLVSYSRPFLKRAKGGFKTGPKNKKVYKNA